MKLQLWKKHISSIDELMGVIYENQSIFKVLKRTDILYKKEIIKTYLEDEKNKEHHKVEKQLLEYVQLNTYNLSLFSLCIPLKRHVLKEKNKMVLVQKNEEMKFSINAVYFNKRTVLILLKHYEKDSISEVLEYANEYVASFLERKRSVWEIIITFFKKIFKIKRR